jgi:NAD(P)-dependent dehydrogenase (short-subunit alcohol dehydrogenase family)
MNEGMFSLAGKVVLLTGAAGILGRHFARALAHASANLALVDVDAPIELASDIVANIGVKARGYACDLRQPDGFESLVDQIEQDFGPVSVLHNNAASKGADLRRFFETDEKFDPALWREIMSVNLDSMFFLARVVGPRMAARGGGSIIQTGSIYGLVAPDQRIYEGSLYQGLQISSPAVYSASKAGVVGLTRHFASLWGQRGVRVNCLVPGGVDSGQNDTFRDNYSRRVPMGRMATPQDLVGPLIFLASDASAYVTGQVLAVDGGLTAW